MHEFADSQIGHLFASGETRADAIRVMLGALREVRVRGEICTIVGYVTDMLQHPDWAGDNISTGETSSSRVSFLLPTAVPVHSSLCVHIHPRLSSAVL